MNLRAQNFNEPDTKKRNLRPKKISEFKETTSFMNTTSSLQWTESLKN